MKKAFQKINEAKNVDPNYYEVYRVGAFLKAMKGDTLGAERRLFTRFRNYADNPRLLYYYAQFLLFHFRRHQKALECAEKVYKLRPEHLIPHFFMLDTIILLKNLTRRYK